MNHEIELKLVFPAKAKLAVQRHPLIAQCEKVGRTALLDNTYFDTPKLNLERHRIAVRVRKRGKKALQTVKTAGTSTAGLSRRSEWEQAYDGRFDFSAIEEPRVAKRLERCRDELTPVFRTRFSRTTYRYQPRNGVLILLMLDSGAIEAEGRSLPINELELELVSGEARDLLALACELARDLPLIPADLSKAAQGYRLFRGHGLTAIRAERIAIDKKWSASTAFQELAQAGLRQWEANVAAARQQVTEADGEEECIRCIHQLRVALRRLRSLLKIFAPLLPEAFAQHWQERFRELAARYGESRDLDVLYSTFLLPAAMSGGVGDKFEALLGYAQQRRTDARRTVLENLSDTDQGLAMLEFSAQLHALSDTQELAETNIARHAAQQLTSLRKRVKRRYREAQEHSPEALHRLRVSLKTLRYGLDFFASLFKAKRVRRYRKKLMRAQNALGFLNDAATAGQTLLGWVEEQPSFAFAAAFAVGQSVPRQQKTGSRIPREIEALLKSKTPW